ncbi:putative F420-0 ABC transporter ATP-binding protein [Cellulomonas sp. P22]|uniref:putative F420-0 ABC transporter ATP-binding protein n=1 Tax=Cellulomonas sp. P22 TaxID=3373189 RepID=UPI0037B1BE35
MSLDARAVSWSAGGHLIIDDVEVAVAPGTLTGLLGPNGSGKSSLLRLVAGVRAPDAGTVRLGDQDLRTLGRRERARRVALVEQESATEVPLTVRDAVLLGRTPHRSRWAGDSPEDLAVVEHALAAVDADGLAARRLDTLSGGERQRVHLARALAQQPELLLLDEPTNHLDVHAQLVTLGLVRRLADAGTGVLAALHDLNLAAAFCDHVVLLSAGRVVAAGPVDEVLVPGVVDQVYGVATTVLRHPRTGRPVLTFDPA